MHDECDTFISSTMAAPAEHQLAWSDCDNDDTLIVDEQDESSRWWAWPVVLGAWAVGAAVLAFVVAVAIMTNRQQPTAPPIPQQPMTTWISPNAGTIVPFPTEPPQNT